jgi:hypothetical protein
MGGCGVLITLDDGLSSRSITDRDRAAGLSTVDFRIVFGSYEPRSGSGV